MLSHKPWGGEPDMPEKDSPLYYDELIEYYYRRRAETAKDWLVCKNEYDASRRRGDKAYRLEELKPARAYSIVSTIESMVLANRPKFFLSGFTASLDEGVVPVFETALNNEWRDDFRLVGETRLCVRDCAKYGIGIMLSSYEADYDTEEQDETASELRLLHKDDPMVAAASASVEAEIAEKELAGEPDELEETWENDSRVVYGAISTRRVSPWDVLVDPDCTGPEDMQWVGRRIVGNLEAVKADKILKNTANLQPSGALDKKGNLRSYGNSRMADNSCPTDMIELYEIFVRKPNGRWDMYLMAEGHDKFLRHEESPFWIGCPYKFLRWNQDGEEFFPQSDVQIVLSEIMAERLLCTKVFDGYSREHVDVTFIDSTLGLSEQEIHAAIRDPEIGKWVNVANPSTNGEKPLSNYFYRPSKDQKSPEAMNLLAVIERMIQVSSGLGPNQLGQALKSGTSATEAAEVGSYAKGRGAAKFYAVEEFLANIAKDRMGLMAQFYTAEDIGRVAGKEAMDLWATMDWTRADVQHGLSIGVEPGSTRQESEESRINQLVTVLGIVNQDPALRALMNIPEVMKELMRLFGFANGSKFLLIQDGMEFGNMAAEMDAMKAFGAGGGSTAADGAAGGSPPAAPGATGAQALGGVA